MLCIHLCFCSCLCSMYNTSQQLYSSHNCRSPGWEPPILGISALLKFCLSCASEIISCLLCSLGSLLKCMFPPSTSRLQSYVVVWLLLPSILVHFYSLFFFVCYCVAICLFPLSSSVPQSGEEHVCQMSHVMIEFIPRPDGWFALWWGPK